jgi:hypothetical protein
MMNEDLQNLFTQLGGARTQVALGCKFIIDSDRNCISLQGIKSNKCNIIRVTIEADGSYTMKFYLAKSWNLKTLDEIFNVEPEQFGELIKKFTKI